MAKQNLLPKAASQICKTQVMLWWLICTALNHIQLVLFTACAEDSHQWQTTHHDKVKFCFILFSYFNLFPFPQILWLSRDNKEYTSPIFIIIKDWLAWNNLFICFEVFKDKHRTAKRNCAFSQIIWHLLLSVYIIHMAAACINYHI